MKLVGITPPLIAFTNSNPVPGLGRLDLDVAVAELAPAAGLLLVAAVRLGGLADRLQVGDLRRVQLDLGAEAALHPVDDHLDVDLGQPGDDLLAGLRVAVDVERRVLLLEAAERRGRLLLVALGLRLVGERHHRRRQLERREARSRRPWLASTSPARVSRSLATAPMSPGPELVDVLELLAARRGELADPLLRRRG